MVRKHPLSKMVIHPLKDPVLGFKKKDGFQQMFYLMVSEDKLVPVRLKSESVSLKWLDEYVKHVRACFEKNQPSDFEAGEETGRIEGLEVMLGEANKQAKKKASK